MPRPPPVTRAVRPFTVPGPSVTLGRTPRWRDESSAIVGAQDIRIDGRFDGRGGTIPELAGHRLVTLVQPLAVVRELAASHQMPEAERDLSKPVGVGEGLPRRRD